MELTVKQRIFCNEYLVDFNATRAYKVAYPSCTKDETARVNGSKLLTNTNIKEFIDKRIKDREKRIEVTQDMIIDELARIAFANGSDFAKVVQKSYMKPVYDDDGNKIGEEEAFYKDVDILETDRLAEDKKKAISCIRNTKHGISVESCDKVKALELLGKHLGIWTDKVELKNTNDKVDLTGLTTEEIQELLKESE